MSSYDKTSSYILYILVPQIMITIIFNKTMYERTEEFRVDDILLFCPICNKQGSHNI